MTDKELLELAAKAAAIPIDWIPKYSHLRSNWNPLINDGDALRLAVTLCIDIDIEPFGCCTEDRFIENITEKTDLFIATRRAIVRAAAEIGKAMR